MLQYLSTALLKTHDLGGWGGEKLFPIVLDPRARHLSPDGPLATCHLRWGRAGPRLQTLRAAMGWTRVLERGVWRPATPRCQGAARPPPSGARCGAHTGAWELGGELVCGRPPAPLRASTPPQRRTPGLYRAQRAALFTLIIHKKATIIKARTTSASVCAPTETGHSGQRTSLQRQRRRRPRVGHRHAPEGEKEKNPLGSRGVGQRPPARVARDV